MRMEGRFVNRFAEDARSLILRSGVPPRLVVNLSEVTFVDTAGEDVLSWFNQVGAQFIATSCYSISVCERLHLRATQNKSVSPKLGVNRRRSQTNSRRENNL